MKTHYIEDSLIEMIKNTSPAEQTIYGYDKEFYRIKSLVCDSRKDECRAGLKYKLWAIDEIKKAWGVDKVPYSKQLDEAITTEFNLYGVSRL